MYEYIDLIVQCENFLQLGIDDDSPMTLFVNVSKDGFSGFGKIYLDLLSLKNAKKDFNDFINKSLNQIKMDDTDSYDYYLSFARKSKYIEIKGKIGNYTNQSLEFCIEFLEEEMIENSKIIALINKIKI